MTDVPPITVGHLKEILKQHNVSDDDTIEFHFCNHKDNESFDEQFPEINREIEFEGHIYKRPFGILMEFEPSIILDEDEDAGDDIRAEDWLGTILKDALNRAQDGILTHPLEIDEINKVCKHYNYPELMVEEEKTND